MRRKSTYLLYLIAILIIVCGISVWVGSSYQIEPFDNTSTPTSTPSVTTTPTTTTAAAIAATTPPVEPSKPTPCTGCNSKCCQSCMNQLSCSNANCKWYAKENDFNGGRCSVPFPRYLDEVQSVPKNTTKPATTRNSVSTTTRVP